MPDEQGRRRSGRPRTARGPELEDEQKKRPSPALIITVIAVIALILMAVLFLLVLGGDLESIAVLNIEKGEQGISFEVMTTASGLGEYDGDCKIEIYYDDPDFPDPIYKGSIGIDDDGGSAEVDYIDFVQGNGDYKVYAKAEGESSWAPLRIRGVVEELTATWEGLDGDIDRSEPEAYVELALYLALDGIIVPQADDLNEYDLEGLINAPGGATYSLTSSDISDTTYEVKRVVPHDSKGEYSVSGTFTNLQCAPSSPYRTIQVSGDLEYSFDALPFAAIGEDQQVSLSNGSAIVTFDASGSWDDSVIVEYRWDFGDNETLTSNNPIARHSYTTAGTYFVTLMVKDDGGQISEHQHAESNTAVVEVN